jgi:hypothetical protein
MQRAAIPAFFIMCPSPVHTVLSFVISSNYEPECSTALFRMTSNAGVKSAESREAQRRWLRRMTPSFFMLPLSLPIRKRDRILNNICRTAEIFVREVLHKSDAMEVLAKLEAAKPNPFALETKTAKITFERYQFSNPREPEEYVSFSLVIEKAQRQPPARSPSHAGSS